MSRVVTMTWVTLAAMFYVFPVLGQQPQGREVREKWIVEVIAPAAIGSGTLEPRVVEQIAVVDTEEDADKAIREWEIKNKAKFGLEPKKRKGLVEISQQSITKRDPGMSENSGSQGTGSKLQLVQPRFVDPGARIQNKSAISLAGRKGQGTIGSEFVTMEFFGQGASGTFVIGGNLRGEGTWKLEGNDLIMETRISRFRGSLNGDTLKGLRTWPDGAQSLAEQWAVTLEPSKPSANVQQLSPNLPRQSTLPASTGNGPYKVTFTWGGGRYSHTDVNFKTLDSAIRHANNLRMVDSVTIVDAAGKAVFRK